MGHISYPRTVGKTFYSRLVNEIIARIDGLLTTTGISNALLDDILALVNQIGFYNLPPHLKALLLAVLRQQLHPIITNQHPSCKIDSFEMENKRKVIHELNNQMLRLALSFDTSPDLSLHEQINATGFFDFKPLADCDKSYELYCTSDGIIVAFEASQKENELGSIEHTSAIFREVLNTAPEYLKEKILSSWENNQFTVINVDAQNNAKNSTTIQEGAVVKKNLTVTQRISKLNSEGHAPIRHGGPNIVTNIQLENRVLRGIDPVSNTTFDAFNKDHNGTPRPHKVGRSATAFTSNEALILADDFVRRSSQFQQNLKKSMTNGDMFVDPIEIDLENVFGKSYKNYVRGVTRLGSKNNPEGHISTNFTNGKIKAIYLLDHDGNVKLHTLYPIPNII